MDTANRPRGSLDGVEKMSITLDDMSARYATDDMKKAAEKVQQ